MIAPVSYGQSDVCTNDLISAIWSELPNCEPRLEVIELTLPPGDPNVVEVIPSHVVVPRCSGVCHAGNLYHRCVPDLEGGRSRKQFRVMFRKAPGLPGGGSGGGGVAMDCALVEVETHLHCKCGCDIEADFCTDKQVG